MRARAGLYILAAATAAIVFTWGLVRLFDLRFQRGDIYPPSSTLRADPLGARLFFESLAALPDYTPERNFRSLGEGLPETPSTLVFSGLSMGRLLYGNRSGYRDLAQFARQGGRVVVLTEAVTTRGFESSIQHTPPPEWEPDDEDDPESEEAPSTNEPAGEEPEEESLFVRYDDSSDEADKEVPEDDESPAMRKRRLTRAWNRYLRSVPGRALSNEWQVAVAYLDQPVDATEAEQPGHGIAIPWHSLTTFAPLDDNWTTVLHIGGKPVWIERTIGKGQLVLISDPYLISNEAMLSDRHPELLLRIAGPHRRVIFDESLHGLTEDRGVMILARKYGLEGFFIAILVLASLFIWRNATSLVPHRPPARDENGAVGGQTSLLGLVNLLRRNIPPSQVNAICLDEWERTRAPQRRNGTASAQRMRALLAEAAEATQARHPLSLYQSIQHSLNEEDTPHA